jgi:uncharacterized protein YkwD
MRRTLIASALAAALIVPSLLAPTVASADLGGVDDEEIAAIEAINQVRVGLGLTPLRLSPILTEAAEWMAQDLANRDTIDHTDSLGRSMGDRVHSFNYPTNAYIRENLVVGTNVDTGAEAVELWQNSAGHKANNEASDVSVAGIARVNAPDTTYKWFWVLNLGSVADTGTMTTTQLQSPQTPPLPPVTGIPPLGSGSGTFTIAFPSSGVGLTVWNGGTLEDMVEGARVGGAKGLFITVGGRWVSYGIGSPAFVNANFAAQFPGGVVPAGTVLLIAK